MLEDVMVFMDRLRAVAKSGETMIMDHEGMKLTVDVIGRAVL